MPTARAVPAALAALACVLASVAVPAAVPTASAVGGAEVAVTVWTDGAVGPVCDDGAAGTTLREALCLVVEQQGGTVVVPAGQVVTLTAGPLTVDAAGVPTAIELRSSGPGRFTVDGNGRRILDLDPSMAGGLDVTVTGAELRGGAPDAQDAQEAGGGGAILAGSAGMGVPDALTIVDSVVRDNRNVAAGTNGDASAPGGAVAMYGGTLTVRGSTFTANVSDGAPGGAIAMVGDASDTLLVEGSTFTGNTVTAGAEDGVVGGGAIFAERVALTVTGGTFTQDVVTSASASQAYGSAVHATGTATFTGSVVQGNRLTSSASRAGGGGGALALAAGTVSASRLVDNADTLAGSTAPVSVLGPVVAASNWWGSTTGAGAGASGASTTTPYVTLTAPSAPDFPLQGVPTVASSRLRLSDGTAAPSALLGVLAGSAASFSIVQASGTGGGAVTVSSDGTVSRAYTPGSETQAQVTVTLDGASVSGPIRRAYEPLVSGPSGAAAAEGSTATFSAAVDAYPAVTALRWQTAAAGSAVWADVPGATSLTLDVSAVRTEQGRRYRVLATNPLGTTTSDEAALDVRWGAQVTAQPQGTTVVAGDDATFSVGVAGNPAPTVQWQSAAAGSSVWSDVPGATDAVYARAAVVAGDDGLQVRAVVQGAVSAVTSDVAVLHVQTPVAVTTSPASSTAVVGTTATFTAVVGGTPAPDEITWQRRAAGASEWVDVPGGAVTSTAGTTTATLDVTASRALDGADYRARAVQTLVTGAREVLTGAATLSVRWAPTITTQPADADVLAGDDATFAVASDAQPVATVTWETKAPGASSWTTAGTGAQLTLPAVGPAADGTLVRARLSNTIGPDVLTDEAELTVRTGTAITTQPVGTTVDEGTTVTFTVAATGLPAPTVRWQERSSGTGTWDDVAGGTGSTLSFVATAARDGHQFRAVAGNGVLADATSDPATLAVLTAPTVTDPADTGAAPGAVARFTVTAGGSPAPSVSWATSIDGVTWTPVPGAAGSTLDLVASAGDDGLLVRAVATSTLVAGSRTVISAPAVLTVVPLPVEVGGPSGLTPSGTFAGTAGASFTLGWVVLASQGVPTWQASRDSGVTWGPIPTGATTEEITGVAAVRSLTLHGAPPATRTAYRLTYTPSAADAGLQLRLVITNPAGAVVLGPVLVQVAPAALAPAATDGSTAGPAATSGVVNGSTARTSTAASGSLARTGADVSSTLALAVLLTASGLIVLVLRRRRA